MTSIVKTTILPLDIEGARRRFREFLNPPRPPSQLMALAEFMAKHPVSLCIDCGKEPAPHLRRPHGKNAQGERIAVSVDPVLICAACERRLVLRCGLEFVPSLCEGPCHRIGVPLTMRGSDPEKHMATCDECENELDDLYEEQRRDYYGGLFENVIPHLPAPRRRVRAVVLQAALPSGDADHVLRERDEDDPEGDSLR